MCGIAGIFANYQPEVNSVENALKFMCHRGPDDQKYKRFLTKNGKHATLLFSRLAIIDVDPRANQPMLYKGVWLTFNGAIYNYKEIRQDLESVGIKFNTNSDTEVLLKALHTYGWDVLDRLEGMWSIAVYDENTNRLSLCRDRFGEKPLIYMKIDGGIVYASEIKILEKLSRKTLQPNKAHIQRFLVNGYKSLYKTNDTFYEGVIDVPSSTLIHFNEDGTVENIKYWKPKIETNSHLSFLEAVNETRNKLTKSLELRLRADVPLAFSLSGGVDSVALVSIARRELGIDVHGFTIRNSDPRYEEWDLVKSVVKNLKIEHSSIDLSTDNFLENLKLMISHRHTPVLTISFYIQWLLMQEISSLGYKVVVGGAGADELFSGYYDHHLLYIAALFGDDRKIAITNWEREIKPFVQNPFLSNSNLFIGDPGFRNHIYLDRDLYSSFLNENFIEEFGEENYSSDLLKNRMLNELFHESIPVMMYEEDLNAMNFSIENRSPYLDRKLMEYAYSIPTRLLVNNGRAKAVLREAVRGIAPDEVLDNPRKIGFNAPIEKLLNLGNKHVISQLFDDSPIFEFVNKKKLKEFILKKHFTNSESKFLFSFISCKLMIENCGV